MMKNYLSLRIFKISCLINIVIVLFSCHTRISIEKRHYRKGYYVSISKIHQSKGEKSENDSISGLTVSEVQKKEISAPGNFHASTSVSDKVDIIINNNHSGTKNENENKSQLKEKKTPDINRSVAFYKSSEAGKFNTNYKLNGKKENNFYFALMVILSFPFLWPLFGRMKTFSPVQLSQWYKENEKTARWHIAGFHFMIFFASAGIGTLFKKSGTVQENDVAFFITTAFGALALLYYSVKQFIKDRAKNFSFKKIIIAFGALFPALGIIYMVAHANGTTTNDTVPYSAGEIILRILLLLVLIGLLIASFYGLAIAACELSCAGYGALAALVFFGGGYITIFLFVFAVKHLFKHKLREKIEKKTQNKGILKSSLLTSLLIFATLIFPFLFLWL